MFLWFHENLGKINFSSFFNSFLTFVTCNKSKKIYFSYFSYFYHFSNFLTFVTCNKSKNYMKELNIKNDEKLISPFFRFINDDINEKQFSIKYRPNWKNFLKNFSNFWRSFFTRFDLRLITTSSRWMILSAFCLSYPTTFYAFGRNYYTRKFSQKVKNLKFLHF